MACIAVLPGEDRALQPLLYLAVSPLGKEPAYLSVLVVPESEADEGSPLHCVPRVKSLAEHSVGRGVEGDRKGEEAVYDPGPPCRWEMPPGGTRLPLHYRCGKTRSGRGGRGPHGVAHPRQSRRQ